MEIRSTEEIARGVIADQFDEIQGYTNPVSDNMLSAWMMALDRAQRMVGTIQTVCDAIKARPVITGNDAMRAIADEPPFSDEPFADDIRATIAARRIPVATPEEDEALDRIEQAHPEPNFAPVDMVDLAARALGFQKGA